MEALFVFDRTDSIRHKQKKTGVFSILPGLVAAHSAGMCLYSTAVGPLQPGTVRVLAGSPNLSESGHVLVGLYIITFLIMTIICDILQ